MSIRVAFIVCGLLCAFDSQAVQSDDSESSETGPATPVPVRTYSELTMSRGDGSVLLNTQIDTQTSMPDEIAVRTEVIRSGDSGAGVLSVAVTGSEGRTYHTADLQVAANPAVSNYGFVWRMDGWPEQEYRLNLELRSRSGRPLAVQRYALTRVVPGQLDQRYVRLRQELDRMLDGGHGSPATRPGRRIRVVERALDGAGPSVDSLTRYRLLEYAASTLDSVRARITFSGDHAPHLREIPPPSTEPLRIGRGQFVRGEHPVFLAGIMASTPEDADVELLADLGLDYYGLALPDGASFDGDLYHRRYEPVISAALAVGSEVALNMRKPPAPFRPPHGVRLVSLYTDIAVPLDTLNQFRENGLRAGFIDELETRYGDRYLLNRIWRTRFSDFSEVDVWPEYEKSAYQRDWVDYRSRLTTSYLEAVLAQAQFSMPAVNFQISFGDDLLDRAAAGLGYDYAAISNEYPVVGVNLDHYFPDPVYGIAHIDPILHFCYFRSVAPQTPLTATVRLEGDPYRLADRDPRQDLTALLWEAAMAGVDAFAVQTGEGGDLMGAGYLDHPGTLEALAVAHYDLNRIAPIVAAFQAMPAPIAVIWSDSSRLFRQGEPYLGSVRRAFEGVQSFGHGVRFVSEDQLARGDVGGIEVIVLPETLALRKDSHSALQDFIDDGGALIRSNEAVSYDPWGQAQEQNLSSGAGTFLVQGNDESTLYLHALDGAFRSSGLPHTPRAVNAYGYPLEGVKSRYAVRDGQEYFYIVNLRNDSITARLYPRDRSGIHVITGREITFPLELDPLEPMLLRLKPESGSEHAPETPAAASR